MNPYRLFRAWIAAAGASLVLPLLASAHPGHDHSDLPSVVRHPFAGVEHAAIIATLLFAAGGAVVLAAWAVRASSRHGARARTVRLR